jgi:demethylmenaquinone methyltransferase/2-methoxy-6-polyprenyl-1,4-benzoquinol methylase
MTVDEAEPGVLRVLQTREETRRFYDKIAHVYDLLAEGSEQPMREEGLHKLAAAPGERILEIGFGTGHCLVQLARAVGPAGLVFGIDLSEKMKDLAQERVQEDGVDDRVELMCHDAVQLPFEDAKLDGIFMSFVLELFDTPEIPVVLEECLRVLKPAGRIVIVAVSKADKPSTVLRAFEWTHQHFPNLLDCRPIYVERALRAAGFDVADQSIRHMWVPVEIVLGFKRLGSTTSDHGHQ